MYEIRNLEGVTDEKDRGVIADKVIVAFFRVKFHCEATGSPFRVGRSLFPSNGEKTGKDFCFFANLRQELSFCVFCNVSRDFKVTMSPSAFGMNHPFGDAFTVKVSELFKEAVVLHEHRSAGPGGHAALVVTDMRPKSGCKEIFSLDMIGLLFNYVKK